MSKQSENDGTASSIDSSTSMDSTTSTNAAENKPFLYQETSTAQPEHLVEESKNVEAPERFRIFTTLFFVAVLFFAIVICYADRANMSFAIIPMSNEYQWTFFVGYVVTQIPSGYLTAVIGGEFVLLVGMIIWSIFTIVTPFTASITPVLFVARAGMGIGEGTAFPAVHNLISQYSKKSERSILVTTITSGSYLGSVLALLLCPLLSAHWGWQSIFYTFGVSGLCFMVIYIPFIIFWRVRAKRLKAAMPTSVNTIVPQSRKQAIVAKLVILKQIFLTPAAWCIFVGQFCNSYGFYFMLSWLPTYYKSAFHTDISELGYFTMLPFAIQGVTCILSGIIADVMISRLKISPKNTRKLLNTIGMFGPAILLALCAFLATNITMGVVFICICLATASFTNASVSVNHLDICAPQYAALVFSIGNTFSNITGVIAPIITGAILDATKSWTLVFVIMIVLYVIGGTFWLIFGRGEVIIGADEVRDQYTIDPVAH